MPYGLYISAEGANAQSIRLDTISNNLANVDTVGFKRELAMLQARPAEAVSRGMVMPGRGALEDLGGGVEVRETKTDFSEGPMKNTKDPNNVAIHGRRLFPSQKRRRNLFNPGGQFSDSPPAAN